MMKAGLIDEMLSDTIDSALDTDDMEEETEEQLRQVIDEVSPLSACAPLSCNSSHSEHFDTRVSDSTSCVPVLQVVGDTLAAMPAARRAQAARAAEEEQAADEEMAQLHQRLDAVRS
jgi:charged multivesicular body protein 3